jgi:bifunctional non-homologous end joining protein LigD
VFDHACRLGLEGIVSKLKTAPYRSGRSKSWLKTKCVDRHELVIIGFVPSATERKVVGSLVVAYHVKDKLVYAGRVGSGFSYKVADDLWQRLEEIRIDVPPLDKVLPADSRRNVRWVKPKLVADIEVRGWTTEGIARHAVFKGLRYDKKVSDVVREQRAVKSKDISIRPVHLTHPDRLLWPDAGITKQGLADFYAELWPWIAAYVVDRPLALVRCPGGVEEPCFFQKHAWAGINERIIRARDPAGGEELLALKDVEGLVSLAQASVLEIHAWGATLDNVEKPDGMTFDLDPDDAVDWADVVAAAFEVRDRLTKAGLSSFVKTTGGKGLHVYAPLKPHSDWSAVKEFAHALATAMSKDAPRKYLATASKQARRGRIFVDYLRNGRGATAVVAYSARARADAAVSTPLDWHELGPDIRSDRFTVSNLMHRLSRGNDPWKDMKRVARRLPPKRP